MDKSNFTFELVDKYAPDVVFEKALRQINEATEGYVLGNIGKYDGPIHSYIQKSGLKATIEAVQGSGERMVNIQNSLGDLDRVQNRFEVFLTAKGLEHYKYRMMFVDYGTVSYPVEVVMDENLAVECFGKQSSTFTIHTMNELEDVIRTVLESEVLLHLIQSLINESIRQENKKTETASDNVN